jgi:hypothetical protein
MGKTWRKHDNRKSRSDGWRQKISKFHDANRKARKGVRTFNRITNDADQFREMRAKNMPRHKDSGISRGYNSSYPYNHSTANNNYIEYDDETLEYYSECVGHVFDRTAPIEQTIDEVVQKYKECIKKESEERIKHSFLPEQYKFLTNLQKQLQRRKKVAVFRGHDRKKKFIGKYIYQEAHSI